MEWLKKHWKILAAVAVGIPLLYWLYQYFQARSVVNAQNATDQAQQNQINQEEQAQSESDALSSLTGGGGVTDTSQTPVSVGVTGTSQPPVISSSVSTSPSTSGSSVGGFTNISGLSTAEQAALNSTLAGNGGFISSTNGQPLTDTTSDIANQGVTSPPPAQVYGYSASFQVPVSQPSMISSSVASPISTLFGTGGPRPVSVPISTQPVLRQGGY